MVWSYHPQSIGRLAIGKSMQLLKVPENLEEYDGGSDTYEPTVHSFLLRHDFKLTIDLPNDFNRDDLIRLENG